MSSRTDPSVAVLLVTMNNRPFAEPCLASVLLNTRAVTFHVYLINNGECGSCAWAKDDNVTVLEPEQGGSWVAGLQAGMDASASPYVLFLNDDVLIPASDPIWLYRMVRRLEGFKVGAVGPSSNCVTGPQSIWRMDPPLVYEARYLISFCCLVKRAALQLAGGLDEWMTDLDDLDYSYRLRQAGFTLLGDRSTFVYHHGFVTGTRLHGPSSTPGGYNSVGWLERNHQTFVARHGQEAWNDLWSTAPLVPWRGEE